MSLTSPRKFSKHFESTDNEKGFFQDLDYCDYAWSWVPDMYPSSLHGVCFFPVEMNGTGSWELGNGKYEKSAVSRRWRFVDMDF